MQPTEGRAWASKSQAERDEVHRLNALEYEFLRSRGLKEYKFSWRNVSRLLARAGADADAVREAMGAIFESEYSFVGGSLDHRRLFGSGGTPTMIVAHPYPQGGEYAPLGEADSRVIEAMKAIGVPTHVGPPSESFYGYGTIHIRIG